MNQRLNNGRPHARLPQPAQHAEPAQQPAPQVPIMPVPTLFGVMQAPGPDGKVQVVLQAQTPLGTFAFMVPPDVAVQLAAQLQRMGSAGNLIVPG